jgi:hypothetical protein
VLTKVGVRNGPWQRVPHIYSKNMPARAGGNCYYQAALILHMLGGMCSPARVSMALGVKHFIVFLD